MGSIPMCNSNVSTLQIASKPLASCEQFHKNACIKLLSHTEQIALCERTLKGRSHDATKTVIVDHDFVILREGVHTVR